MHLPDCYQVNDRRRAIAERAPTRAEPGLPETGFVFCCFNNNYKITPAVFDVWMRLLRAVAGQRAVAAGGQPGGGAQPAAGGGGARRRAGAAGVRAADAARRAPRAAPAGRSVPRHAALQRAHHGERRAVGRPAGPDLPWRRFAGPRGGEPAARRRPARAGHASLDDYEALALRLARAGAAGGAIARGSRAQPRDLPALRHRALPPPHRVRLHHDVERGQRGEPPASFAVAPLP